LFGVQFCQQCAVTLHAAARAVILIQKALPVGSYQLTNLTALKAAQPPVELVQGRLRRHRGGSP
jgi:hypothetical protein